jgi:hypothetical protein
VYFSAQSLDAAAGVVGAAVAPPSGADLVAVAEWDDEQAAASSAAPATADAIFNGHGKRM